jgi:integral membrane sensor domain MASE1
MDYTDHQKQEFRDDFAARRKRQLLATLPILLVVVALAMADQTSGQLLGFGVAFWGPVAFVCILGFIVFTLKNWRCPACARYLGKGIFPRCCPKCGVQLSA